MCLLRPQVVSTLFRMLKISFKKNSSKKIFYNGEQIGECFEKIDHCFSRTIERECVFELKEKLIVINEPLRKTVAYRGTVTESYRDLRNGQHFTRKMFNGVNNVEEKMMSPDFCNGGQFSHLAMDYVNEAKENFWSKYSHGECKTIRG